MHRKLIIAGGLVLLFVVSFLARDAFRESDPQEPGTTPVPQRIVSLSPSVTETLFALGLGDKVVGVTRYCDYPPEAQELPKVGGYVDPNYEAIVGLRPDLVILLEEHQEAQQVFADQGQATLVIRQLSVDDIMDSIAAIGEACGAQEEAEALLADCRARMAAIAAKTKGQEPPRVLLAVSREGGAGTLGQVYIAGEDGLYNRMLQLAGGMNAYEGEVKFPVVSAEGILRMNPDVIIELAEGMAEENVDLDARRADWETLTDVKAVRDGRVHLLTEDYVVIPGPRFVKTLELLASLLHPDLIEAP